VHINFLSDSIKDKMVTQKEAISYCKLQQTIKDIAKQYTEDIATTIVYKLREIKGIPYLRIEEYQNNGGYTMLLGYDEFPITKCTKCGKIYAMGYDVHNHK